MSRRAALGGALAAALAGPAAAQDGAVPRDGVWESRGVAARTMGCGPELGPALEALGRAMGAPRREARAWDGAFDPRTMGLSVGEGTEVAWTREEVGGWTGALSGTTPEGEALPYGRVEVELITPDTIETRTVLDAAALRRIGGRPVAPGTEACTLLLRGVVARVDDADAD